MLKFKSWKGKDKWLFFLTIGVILCILAFPAEGLSQKSRAASGDAAGIKTNAAGRGDAAGKEDTDYSLKDTAADAPGRDEILEAAAGASNSYEAELEKRVREILKNVDGVGTVDVMIVLKSSAQKVVHTDSSSSRSVTDEKDSTGGSRKIESEENGVTTVLTSGDGQSTPIIEKELRPELSGIIISASGGGNPTVRAEISAAMEALFDLPAHKIKVLKRVE